jgi:ATP-dependent exoDNAse (exonuclease V) beta subunit
VIKAPQAAILVPAKIEGGPPVRTELVDQTDITITVAKRDKVFAKQAHADRLAVGLYLLGHERRNPVMAHQLSHWGIALNFADKPVFFLSNHENPYNFA